MKTPTLVIPATRKLVNIVEKVWGYEEWIVNNDKYCGKKLIFKAGHHCSLHFHKIKHETFYLQSGTIILELEVRNKKQHLLLNAGDSAEIIPLMKHKIIALSPAEVIEFSTHHEENDSYRITPSGKLNTQEFSLLQENSSHYINTPE